jgi:hypothetical protein
LENRALVTKEYFVRASEIHNLEIKILIIWGQGPAARKGYPTFLSGPKIDDSDQGTIKLHVEMWKVAMEIAKPNICHKFTLLE